MKKSWGAVIGIAFILIGAVFSFPKIAQDHEYHDFADSRPWAGIPNAADVLSNIAFCIVGVIGLQYVLKNWRSITPDRVLWLVFFIASFMIGVGSGYYHLDPDNDTLFWDRLPMSIAFMALFAIVIGERAPRKVTQFVAPLLIFLGAASVLYWRFSEMVGMGDLRPYIAVQFFPLVSIPLLAFLIPVRTGNVQFLYGAIASYAAAKFFEIGDGQIFDVTHGAFSGHSLKHLAAAAGIYCIFRYLKSRPLI